MSPSPPPPGTAPHRLPAPTVDDPREVGGYRVVARLGAGGMGRVYLAYTPGGRPVALKVVRPELAGDPEFRRRFAREVVSAQRIHGLYTAQVVDSGAGDPTPWLATTYVPGPSLQQAVHSCGPLPVRTVLLLVAGIAEALQEIHRAGVVHRDLKPANVLIAADGPRVIDFGIARAADAGALTGTGLRVGTPAFMAPEQAPGRPVVAAAALLLGAAGAFALLDPHFFGGGGDEDPADPAEVVAGAPASSPAATPASTPAATPTPEPSTPPAAPGYTAVHTGTELASPDQSYEFDVKEGRVVPQETASWYVGRSTTEFYVPESSDAYVLPFRPAGARRLSQGHREPARHGTALHHAAGRAGLLRPRPGRPGRRDRERAHGPPRRGSGEGLRGLLPAHRMTRSAD